jgi:hypothetical protein
MSETNQGSQVSITRLILVPALITLGVTILRLVGELQHWSQTFFKTSAGGAGAIVGIVWLAPIFGIYFALKLAGAGEVPASAGKAIGFAFLGLIVLAGGLAVFAQSLRMPLLLIGAIILLAGAVAVEWVAWPALAKTMLAYGYLARIPVAIVMFFAIRGNWGTHYDAPPPGFPEMAFWPKYLLIGVVPQLVLWIAFTAVVGALFGSIANALLHRGKVAAHAAS